MRAVVTLVVVLGAAACGPDDDPRAADAATGDAADDATVAVEIAPVTAPSPPTLAPCTGGWLDLADPDAPRCAPFPPEGPTTCADGEAHFPGEPGCATVGATCPAGDFPGDLPATGVVYVRAGATAGDGTRAAPFATIGEAVTASVGGGVVAAGPGAYDELVTLTDGVELRGACPTTTRVRAVAIAGSATTVRDVTVGPATGPGIDVPTGSVRIEGVIVTATHGAGVSVTDGEVTAREVSVSDVEGAPTTGEDGQAFVVSGAGSVSVERAVLANVRSAGVLAIRASATVRDTWIHDVQAAADAGGFGQGLYASSGATLTAHRVVVERSRTIGAFATSGSSLTIDDGIIRETRPRERDGVFGRGIAARDGGSVHGTRVLLERNMNTGAFAIEAGSLLRLEDAIVRDTDSASDGEFGRGVTIQDGAHGELARVLVLRNRDVGVFVLRAGMTPAASLDAEDLVVADTVDQRVGPRGGWGLGFQAGAVAQIRRATLDSNSEVGLYASGAGTQLTVEDLAVYDTTSLSTDGTFGRGLAVQRGVVATVDRAVVERSRDVGVYASQATLTLSDVAVDVVAPPACVDAGCGEVAAGIGSFNDATTRAERFQVTASDLCGVFLSRGGELDLMNGSIERAAIGACVQSEGYDLARLSTGVVYRDNEVNLQATSLPVPEDSPPI